MEPGETEHDALVRECEEELGVVVEIGERVGERRAARARSRGAQGVHRPLVEGVPQLIEHAELRWLAAHELHTVPWLPADAPIVAALPKFMGDGA